MSQTTKSDTPSPLFEVEQDAGARCAPYRGVLLPADYGAAQAEYTALRQASGLFDRRGVELYEMTGADRHRFLNAYVTCDVKGLVSQTGAYGFVTSAKGRILADLTVLALEDRFLLELPPGLGEEIANHLRKYVIVDRIDLKRREDLLPLTLLGPTAPQVLESLGVGDELEIHGHRLLSVADAELVLAREADLNHSAWTLWTPVETVATVFRELLAAGREAGLVPVGHDAVERLRVEAGRPLFGVDFGPDHFPEETGLGDRAVSFTKGCYLGQEVVARIHYRGGVNRQLRGLAFGADSPPPAELVGRAVLVEGRAAGTVSSAVASFEQSLGLSILHKRAETGAQVEVEGGARALVVDLPFPMEG